MTAMSFSIATTVPLMTEPSCRLRREGLIEHRGKIVAGRVVGIRSTRSHLFSSER